MSALHLRSIKVALDESITGGTVTAKTPKLAPMAAGYTADPVTDEYYSDISASLAAGASLITLASFSVNIDSGNTRIEIDAADISEATQTFTSDKFAIVLDTGVAATSPVLCTIDHTSVSPLNGTYAITFNAEGILQIPTT